jgi:hypothetical protein
MASVRHRSRRTDIWRWTVAVMSAAMVLLAIMSDRATANDAYRTLVGSPSSVTAADEPCDTSLGHRSSLICSSSAACAFIVPATDGCLSIGAVFIANPWRIEFLVRQATLVPPTRPPNPRNLA